MAYVDLLKPDGPKAKLTLNMNEVYIYLGNNFSCVEIVPTGIRIAFIAMENGVPKPDQDYQSYVVPTYELFHLSKEKGIPDFNYKISIKNLEYKFEFSFVYEFLGDSEAEVEFYSEVTTIMVDNTIPTICTKTTSSLVQADLAHLLSKREDFTIFFNALEPIPAKIGDIKITLDGLSIHKVKDINGTSLVIEQPDKFSMALVRYIIEHKNISGIVSNLTGPGMGPSEIIFQLELNRIKYHAKLSGILTSLK